jgi:hypothetical protein
MIFPHHYIICFLRVTISIGLVNALYYRWHGNCQCCVHCLWIVQPHLDPAQEDTTLTQTGLNRHPHACETCMQTLSCRALNRSDWSAYRLVRLDRFAYSLVRLLCGDPLILRWSAYCAVVRLFGGGPLIVRWSDYVMVRLLCGGPLIM